MWLQYRLIIQFFMVAALVATNVFNVFTMNLGTTGLPLGQVCTIYVRRCCSSQHACFSDLLFATAFYHAQHAVDEAKSSRADVHFVLLQGDSFRDSQLGFTLTAVVSCAGSAVLLFLSLAYMRYKRMLMW